MRICNIVDKKLTFHMVYFMLNNMRIKAFSLDDLLITLKIKKSHCNFVGTGNIGKKLINTFSHTYTAFQLIAVVCRSFYDFWINHGNFLVIRRIFTDTKTQVYTYLS